MSREQAPPSWRVVATALAERLARHADQCLEHSCIPSGQIDGCDECIDTMTHRMFERKLRAERRVRGVPE